jgi:thioesterase domain-containing protein
MSAIEHWHSATDDAWAGAVDGAQMFPMASAQLGVWFTEQFAGASAANNLSFAIWLSGKVDVAALEFSLLTVMLRHEALRTRFDLVEGRPVQIVRQEPPEILTRVDVSHASEPEAAAYAAVREVAHTPFDLTKGPLLRVLLVEQGPQQNILCCTMHHIVADGWSFGLFMRELASCYAAARDRRQPTLQPLPLRYTDCVLWEQQWLLSEEFRIQLANCIRPLTGAQPQPSLAIAAESSPMPSMLGASRAVRIVPELLAAMKSISLSLGATPFALSLATFQLMLWQTTGQEDVVVGIPVARRNRVEVENIIGLFANLSAARVVLHGDPEFVEVLKCARDATLNALAYEDVPFHRVVQALHPARTIGTNPIFRALFASVPAVAAVEWFGGLRAAPYVVAPGGALYELSFSMIEDESGGVWLRAEYRTELFEDRQIADLLDHYVGLLAQVTAWPHRRISSLAGLPASWLAHRQGTQGRARIVPRPAPVETTPFDRALEEILARIWRKVLRCPRLERNANFFDLGGDSLHALSIAHEIGSALGKPIPVSLVFREPTIQGMARWLRTEGRAHSGLIPIRLDGTRRPLFVGGDSSSLRSLGRVLRTEQPFYLLDLFSLQEQRLLGGQSLLASLPEIAAQFVRDILAIQPVGPYFLAGLCDGGILALEIALKLQAAGHQVALLAMLDTPVDGYFRLLPWGRRIRNPGLITAVALARAGNVAEILRRTKEYILLRRLVKYVRARRGRRQVTPEEGQSAQIWAAIWNAVLNYRQSTRFAGEIEVFRAEEPIRIHEDTALGWDRRAEKVRIHDVPGDHSSFLLEPATQERFAEAIEAALRRAGCGRRPNEL